MSLRPALLAVSITALCAACVATPMREPVADTVAAPALTAGAQPPLIPREKLFGDPSRANVQISPDGKYLSWIAPRDGVMNLWVAPADNMAAAQAITNDRARGVRNYFWTYKPGQLLYLRDTGGDEDFRLYAVAATGGAERDLTPYPKTTAQVLAVSPQQPDSIVVGLNDRDAKWHDVYRVDLATGKRTLLQKNADQYASFIVDDTYAIRLATRSLPDGSTEVLVADGTGGFKLFEKIPFEDSLSTAPTGYSRDGKTLYWIESRQRNTAALYAIGADGKRTLVYENPRADVDETLVEPRSGRVQAVSSNYLRNQWTVLDPAIEADFKRIRALGPGEASVVSRTFDDRTWIVAYSAAETPTAYYRFDRDAGTLAKIISTRPELEGAALAPMWPVEIKSRDDRTLVSYLTLPLQADANNDGRADRPTPLVLLVHGGPWARDAYGYSGLNQWLANRGYAVLSVNYRGSAGFGKDFVNLADGQWAAGMHDDLIDAVDWAVKSGVTNKDQVAIMGGSYGGYATLVGLTYTPETFKCGVDIVGPSNLKTLLDTIPPYWASFYEQFARRMGDPRTEAGRKMLYERSPLNRADKIVRPLLIGQGANDPRVKQAESDQIVAAMKARNIPVTYALFPDEGHGFRRPENSKAFNAVTEAFLGQCLGGRVEPIGDDFAGSSLQVPEGAAQVPGLVEALRTHTPNIRK